MVVRSENEVQGSLAGSVEQVEVAQPEQCNVLPQDVVGWWHAGQGVTDFDSGGDEVYWNYGHAQPPAVGDQVTFDGSGMRTYSLAVSVVYEDDTCTNLQDELTPIVATCCNGGNCDGGGMPATCSAPTCAATFTNVYRKCLDLIAQDPAADLYASFNEMCVIEEGTTGSATSQWCAMTTDVSDPRPISDYFQLNVVCAGSMTYPSLHGVDPAGVQLLNSAMRKGWSSALSMCTARTVLVSHRSEVPKVVTSGHL